MRIVFTIPGLPVPAVRMTQRSKWKNLQAQRYLSYREQVRWHARIACAEPLVGPVALTVDVYYQHPASRRADVSNILKAIEDGASTVLYQDDRQVVDAHIRVREGEDRVVVQVQDVAGWSVGA